MTKKRILLSAAVLAVPAAIVGWSVLPSNAATVPAAGSTYTLAVKKSGMCVDVPSAAKDDKALLQQWGCTANAAWQQFQVVARGGNFQLKNVNSGKCVDVPSASTASGVRLWQYTCGTGTNQQWRFVASGTGTFQIVSVSSGLCVSDQAASTASGAAIIQETCTANSNKQWAFTPVTGSTATPAPTASGGRTWSDTADGFASTGGGTTGGAAGTTVTVKTQADLTKYVTAAEPYVIRVAAPITITPKGTELKVTSNKTIVGAGTSGQILQGGFFLGAGVRNVIIRNLTIKDAAMAEDDPDDKVYDYDGIQMDTADHIWIDHNTITNMNDGLIDSRKDTTYLTVSWNVLSNENKAFGIGWTDNVTARMTIHHNWIHDTNQRNPSVDNVALAHLYNNYMQNITSYGNLSRGSTKLVLENSYFDHVVNPYYNDTSAAQLKQSGSVVVNSSGKQQTNGSAFNPKDYYSYALDAAADVPALLKKYAGPQATIGN